MSRTKLTVVSGKTEIKIEKGVPLEWNRRRRSPRYPWQEMEIGDSFVVPTDINVNSFRRMASWSGRSLGRQFSVRKTDTGGYRCWRVL